MRRGWALAGLGFAMLLAACGDAAGGPGGGRPPSAPSRAAAAGANSGAVPALDVTATVRMAMEPAGEPVPTLTDVAFASARVGVAVGSACAGISAACGGVILATGDGGQQWREAAAVPVPLAGVAFAPGGTVFAWGEASLYRSADGGTSWSRVPLPAYRGFTRIRFASFTSAEAGWVAVGGPNCASMGCPLLLLRTVDAGARWVPVADDAAIGPRPSGLPPPSLGWATFSAGGYLGQGHGYLVTTTPDGAVLTTADGGARWSTSLNLHSGGAAAFAALTGSGDGWAATAGGRALEATTDGGASWTPLGVPGATPVGLFAAADRRSGWLLEGASGAPCAGTPPFCGTAVQVAGPAALGPVRALPSGYSVSALAPLDAQAAWAVGGGPASGSVLLQTADGGLHWSVAYRAGGLRPTGSWGFWNATDGWAEGSAADAAALLRTADGGRTWSAVGRLPVATVQAIGFPTPRSGWVLDGDGRLLVSGDGGATWQARALPRQLFCVAPQLLGFSAPDLGWASVRGKGCDEPLLRTSDGGLSWAAAPAPAGGRVLGLAFNPTGTGWAVVLPPVGDVLLERADPGRGTWTPVASLGPAAWSGAAPPPAWVGAPLSIDPAGNLWLGDLRSADGGRTWTRFTTPAGAQGAGGGAGGPFPIAFATARVGWAQVGPGLYRTTDGGSTWRWVSALGAPPAGAA